MGVIPSLITPLLPPSGGSSLLTRSAGGFERMMGVFCMTDVLVSSLPSCGEGGQLLRNGSLALPDTLDSLYVTYYSKWTPLILPTLR